MGILEGPLLTGINPKQKPTNRGFTLKKEDPLGPYNFPLTKYTHWKAFGYKKDMAGIKRPYWINKTLPTGHPFIPELDEVVEVTNNMQGIVEPRKEHQKAYHRIPYLENKEVKFKTQDL